MPAWNFAQVVCGAQQTDEYFHFLKNKNIGIVANPASRIGSVNIVDSLLRLGIKVEKVFCPEHGFRNFVEEGKSIQNSIDSATGIKIISLYGKKKKPDPDDLKDIDLLLFDLQDVGARFFTYLSTLALCMESCAENKIPVILLDRPNPNGSYIDGPVMEPMFISFVGLHPVPVVYGMTIGEYAQMVNGEGWLRNGVICDLTIIQLKNYTHHSSYELPFPPSPNLRNMNAIKLYPSLCFFEGTIISVGRGTPTPFEVFGHPEMEGQTFSFIPRSSGRRNNSPLYNGKECFGMNLENYSRNHPESAGRINLSWLMMAYREMGKDAGFFNIFFDKLAGNSALKQQIINGISEEEIRESWNEKLNQFREIRAKYLLYKE